jgi:hypothetical protein
MKPEQKNGCYRPELYVFKCIKQAVNYQLYRMGNNLSYALKCSTKIVLLRLFLCQCMFAVKYF